jgi:hypothetical protein
MEPISQKLRYSINDLIFLLNSGRNSVYDAINSGELETYFVRGRRYSSPAAARAYVELKERQAKEQQAKEQG